MFSPTMAQKSAANISSMETRKRVMGTPFGNSRHFKHCRGSAVLRQRRRRRRRADRVPRGIPQRRVVGGPTTWTAGKGRMETRPASIEAPITALELDNVEEAAQELENVAGVAQELENVAGQGQELENVEGTALELENIEGTALELDNVEGAAQELENVAGAAQELENIAGVALELESGVG